MGAGQCGAVAFIAIMLAASVGAAREKGEAKSEARSEGADRGPAGESAARPASAAKAWPLSAVLVAGSRYAGTAHSADRSQKAVFSHEGAAAGGSETATLTTAVGMPANQYFPECSISYRFGAARGRFSLAGPVIWTCNDMARNTAQVAGTPVPATAAVGSRGTIGTYPVVHANLGAPSREQAVRPAGEMKAEWSVESAAGQRADVCLIFTYVGNPAGMRLNRRCWTADASGKIVAITVDGVKERIALP